MAEIAELNEQSTTDEVQQYVEKVVQEVKADRAGEKKSDAQITSEHANNVQTPVAEKKSGDVSAKSKDKGEVTAKADSGGEVSSWIDDDTKAEIAAYGLKESDLSDFASREELDRALRFVDRIAIDAGRKALAEGDGEQTRNEKGQFVAKTVEHGILLKKEETPAAPEGTKGGFQISLDKDIYDEEIVGQFTAMRDHYESRLQALESRLLENDALVEEQHFDSLVDSLGHEDLFGKTGSEDATQLQRRKDLHVQAKALQNGLRQFGHQADLDEGLVNRVARMVFAEELGKKDLKNRTRKISRQSNGRQGGGAIRPQDAPESGRDRAERRFRELEQS